MDNKGTRYLYFNSRDELYRIDMHSIVCIEADGNYTHIMLRNRQRGTICMSLMQMQAILDQKLGEQASIFARIGKRHIVNLSYVYHIHSLKQQLTLSDGCTFSYEINASKEALRQLKELFVSIK
ncbi:MAG: LytTR family transcriptional regulator [Bacteroidales bacterium]|nr:LytTR family transcriptional regulator [Bacteroidales bacterium]